jgi:hypothetical protein
VKFGLNIDICCSSYLAISKNSYQVTAGQYGYDLGTWRNIYAGALKDYEVVRKLLIKNKNGLTTFATVMQSLYIRN